MKQKSNDPITIHIELIFKAQPWIILKIHQGNRFYKKTTQFYRAGIVQETRNDFTRMP